MKKGAIILNGDYVGKELASHISADYIIACDGGLDKVPKNVKIDYLIGDMDSVSQIPEDIKIIKYPTDKDYTDGYLGMEKCIELGCDYVEIYGALGGRPDHYYANLSLLYQALVENVKARIIDEKYDICLVNGLFSEGVKINKIFSIVPFFEKAHIQYTKGLKFPMHDQDLNKRHILSISNQTLEEIVEFYSEGEVLVFIQK